MAKKCRVFFWGHGNVLKVTVVMDAQLCDSAKSHGTICFKWMSRMVYELYFNKAVKIGRVIYLVHFIIPKWKIYFNIIIVIQVKFLNL